MEKQKILQAGINRSMQLTDVSKKENKVLQSSTTASADTVVDKKNPSSSRQCETNPSTSASSKSATAVAKPKSSESTKKPSSGPVNFFDRYNLSFSFLNYIDNVHFILKYILFQVSFYMWERPTSENLNHKVESWGPLNFIAYIHKYIAIVDNLYSFCSCDVAFEILKKCKLAL